MFGGNCCIIPYYLQDRVRNGQLIVQLRLAGYHTL